MILNSPYISGSITVTNLSGSGVRYLMTSASGLLVSQTPDAAIKTTYTASATAGQTVFPVTNGYSTGLVDVYLNGTKLSTSDYSDADGLNITLVTGSDAGDLLEFVKYSPALGVTNNALRQLTTFTSSEGQTVYSASYTPGLLDVYYNGSRLTPTEYTATNGTFITLATGSSAGDVIDMLAYSYQVGAFTGIGGGGVANQIAFYNTTSSISGSSFLTVSGSNIVITGSLLITGSLNIINSGSLFVSSSGFVGLNTTQNFNSTLTIAPLKTPGVALQVIADKDGRATSIYTSDYVSLATGSTLRMGFVTGSGNTNAIIQAYTAGENNTGSLILNNGGGNVGIGVSPTDFGSQYTVLDIYNATVGGYMLVRNPTVTGQISVDTTAMYVQTRTNHPILFTPNNAEKMRITSAGAVGINTSSPSGKLDVNGRVYIRAAGSSTDAVITFINQSGGDGTMYVTGTSTSLNYAWNTYSVANAFYIQNNGNIGIANASPSYKLDILQSGANSALNINLSYGVSGGNAAIIANIETTAGYLALWRYGGVTKGSITTDGGSVAYNTTSDYRLKEDLKDFNGLEKISAIKTYNFKWKNSTNRMDGVIAHELAEILPYAVSGEKDALDKDGNLNPQSVDYSKLVPVLIKALQEANAKITALEEKLERNNIQ